MSLKMLGCIATLSLSFVASSFPSLLSAGPPSDAKLQQEARSILSNRCFACHGPDEEQIEAGLRLDDRKGATAILESGKRAIAPGKPSESELLLRIESRNPDERMPPPRFGEPLSEKESRILKEWIERGAEFAGHWSFVPPVRPLAPTTPHPSGNGSEETWSLNAIDPFILQKMNEHGLSPSRYADRATLLRRVSLDLIGLPPTLEELDAFLSNDRPDAFEVEVDRLLASPQFGEHWARKWLDLARYADSAGYADDPPRTIWAYRDWVIRSLNQDMPFDQFTREQLAGDLLPNPTLDQLTATAFHRNTLTNNEGGTNDEEFRNVAIVDRVNTTMAVWMGVTMACAQCHSHKYDPISQKEYFEVFSIFNQSQDADKRDESPTVEIVTEEQSQNRLRWKEQIEQHRKELESVDPKLEAERLEWERRMTEPTKWLLATPFEVATTSPTKTEFAQGDVRIRADQPSDRDTIEIVIPLASEKSGAISPDNLRALQIETLPADDLPQRGAGFAGNFVVTNVTAELFQEKESRVPARFVRVELKGESKILSLAEVEVIQGNVEGTGSRNVAPKGKASQSSTDYGGEASFAIDGNTSGKFEEKSTTHTSSSKDPWWEVDLGETKPIERIVIHNRTDGNVFSRLDGAKVLLLDSERKEVSSFEIKKGNAKPMEKIVAKRTELKWSSAIADFEQPGFTASMAIDSKPDTGWAVGGAIESPHTLTLLRSSTSIGAVPKVDEEPMRLKVTIECKSTYAKHVLASFRIKMTSDPDALQKSTIPKPLFASFGNGNRSSEESHAVAQYYQSKIAPSYQKTRDSIAELESKLAKDKPATTVPIMRDLGQDKQRKSFIHVRGNYRSEGEVVQPQLPKAFHPLRASGKEAREASKPELERIDRLVLAEWLMQSDNPLTARVMVNRVWESLFGAGLVRTSEDFGSQGDLPTHPELLDWLATEFIRNEWNTKRLLRTLVTSATYQQQSNVTREQLERDSENVFLARGPRVRLSAEQIRDQALAVSGLLSHRMYGEPVRPRQPNSGLSAAFGSKTDWETSTGENSFRRGLYTVWRRSNPYPSMATFDAPNREVCTLRRDRTNTPLQALVTLNDPVYVEAAQALARRVLLIDGRGKGRVEQFSLAFRLVTSRNPSGKELEVLETLWQQSLAGMQEDTAAARRMANDPIGPLPDSMQEVVSVSELAAWTIVANAILNLDEIFMTR